MFRLLFILVILTPLFSDCFQIFINDSNSVVNETAINSGDTLNLKCVGDVPLDWEAPLFNSAFGNEPPSPLTFKSKKQGNQYETVLTLSNADYLYTGYYSCHPKGQPNAIEKESIYVYVKDQNHLLVVNDSVVMITVKEFDTLVIPCRPSSPDVNVTLTVGGETVERVSGRLSTNFLVAVGLMCGRLREQFHNDNIKKYKFRGHDRVFSRLRERSRWRGFTVNHILVKNNYSMYNEAHNVDKMVPGLEYGGYPLVYDPKVGFSFSCASDVLGSSYRCFGELNGKKSKMAVFSVIIPPHMEKVEMPYINSTLVNHLLVGDTAVLDCSVKVDPGIIITMDWVVPNQELFLNNHIQSVQIPHQEINEPYKHYVEHKRLIINNVTLADAGKYVCNVTDHAQTGNQNSIDLKVYH